ncbi:hypothetical protein [Aquicoccus sp. SU-CL01552]|uniref:hypothetical protein n=1 Tax=Aquicoccus sp. SU-CL01552 TaxID=3127656 RepID=UPI00310A9D0F
MADDFAYGMARGTVKVLQSALDKANAKIRDLTDQCWDHFRTTWEWNIVAKGREAENEYLLKLLYEAHGGPENNPARKQAYKDSDPFRIPNGPRAGQRAQMRDHILMMGMVKAAKKAPDSVHSVKRIRSFIKTIQVFK